MAVEQWILLWKACHNVTGTGILQWCWPDGGSLLEQDAVTVQVFGVLTGIFAEAMAEQFSGR